MPDPGSGLPTESSDCLPLRQRRRQNRRRDPGSGWLWGNLSPPCKSVGVIPQIAAVLGPCSGGACYSAALCDFVCLVKGIGQMCLTGPRVVESVLGQKITLEELGGAKIHTEISGVAHALYEDENLVSTESASFSVIFRIIPGRRLSENSGRESGDGAFRGPEDGNLKKGGIILPLRSWCPRIRKKVTICAALSGNFWTTEAFLRFINTLPPTR